MTSTDLTPSTVMTAAFASDSILPRSGQAGVVSMIVNVTLLARDFQVADHVQRDQVLVQFGFLDLAQRRQDGFFCDLVCHLLHQLNFRVEGASLPYNRQLETAF